MNLKTEILDELHIVTVYGRLDALTHPEFEKQVLPMASAGDTRLLVDLSGLDYISSAGLRSFVILERDLRAHGGRMAVFGLNEMVSEVFRISGFNTLVKVFGERAAAVDYLKGKLSLI